jgi:hypothetical protein
MTAVKPKSNHPWRASIKDHVDEAKIRGEIKLLRKQIDLKKAQIKELEKKLSERSDG